MKSDPSNQEIDDLLRSRTPEVGVPPGLEGRILRAIGEERHRPRAIQWWRWLLLPPAVALLAVLLAPDSGEKPAKPIAENPQAPDHQTNGGKATKDPAAVALSAINPLEKETQALKRDAERAGKFLLDCLPSVNSIAEK